MSTQRKRTPRPNFLNPSAAPKLPATVVTLAKDLFFIFTLFFVVVGTCAFLYWLGSQSGWGIERTFKNYANETISWREAFHFSVITITTVGYGDFRPVSYGRLIADIEAVVGVIFMGWLVSKLIARQQDRLIKFLVRGHFNDEAQNFRDQLILVVGQFEALKEKIYGPEASDFLYKASGLVRSLARYWRNLSETPDLDDIIQSKAVGRILGDVVVILSATQTLIQGMTFELIPKDDHNNIRNLTESALVIATVIDERIGDDDLLLSCDEIYTRVAALRMQLTLSRTKH